MLNLPKYGIKELYLFPYYQTREEFERLTGLVCPGWIPNRRPKYWFDPAAERCEEDEVIYDLAYRGNIDAEGKPKLKRLILYKFEAATVNIPPSATNVPGADQPEIPCPVRALEDGEELAFGFGGVVEVRNKALYAQATQGGDFTEADRALLKAIGKKLGVEV